MDDGRYIGEFCFFCLRLVCDDRVLVTLGKLGDIYVYIFSQSCVVLCCVGEESTQRNVTKRWVKGQSWAITNNRRKKDDKKRHDQSYNHAKLGDIYVYIFSQSCVVLCCVV